ncbi:MAG: hypothetical protein OSJ58_11865 [Dysosmobacter sp.]|uniref:hypothetical protein n=1 Tax=uncultured Oscillibacter sp. TaxID=876091 RepID=UPI00263362CF|nr:hypothetical protein [uncultured Oscillibacter sp.]MCX4372498.1 hypothetical protein [Dysosmobacter sp.]
MEIQNYFRSYVSSVIARDQAKFEKSPAVKKAAQKEAQAALSDDVVAQIKEHAKKDAQVNVYMQKDYIRMINAHKQQRVSPDRQEAISRATLAINSAARGKGSSDLLSMLLGKYSMNAWIGGLVDTAEIYAPNGEMIASYNSSGGWTEISTEAEYQFLHQADQIYHDAFREARAEINAAAKSPAPEPTGETTFDTRV